MESGTPIRKVGLISIATGKYISLLPSLMTSARGRFLPKHEVQHLVFSNHPPLPGLDQNAGWFPIPHLPWPLVTLLRYHYILQQEDWLLDHFDYLYYLDVDMRIEDIVGDEILGELVAVQHPCFWDKPASKCPFERRPQSSACVYAFCGNEKYHQGSFQGGRTEHWLGAARTIRDRINRDLDNRVIAIWHDESHWNKVLTETPPAVSLSPAYSYPEAMQLPFPRKITALDKNHQEIRA